MPSGAGIIRLVLVLMMWYEAVVLQAFTDSASITGLSRAKPISRRRYVQVQEVGAQLVTTRRLRPIRAVSAPL